MSLPFALLGIGGLELIGFVFVIWTIYECATRERVMSEKLLWLLLIFIAPVVGSLIYFLVRIARIRG